MESCGKLTEGLPAAQKFDGRYSGRTKILQKLMEGLPAVDKVNGSKQKFSRLHGKLLEVHGMSPATRKVDGS